jgi:beta-galactosidase
MNPLIKKISYPAKVQRALLLALILFSTGVLLAEDSPRERLLLDSGWKFHLGDLNFEENIINAGINGGPAKINFNDSKWRTVNLPHDWAVELPFDPKANGSHGYKPVGLGFPTNSISWYRRSFTLSKADKGQRLWLEFGGVYRNCRVFLNGFKLTHHEGGYNGFRCDITDVARYGGQNLLAVRVDASEFEGWFYEGAGIYRHVWLVKTAPLAIAPNGIFVYSQFKDNVPQGPAQIHLETKLLNSQDTSADAKVNWKILAPDGKVVAQTDGSETVDSWGTKEIKAAAEVPAPVLWSPESPKLYQLITTVESGGQLVDRVETEFGIRTLAFDANQGFLLNGKRYTVKGTCNHQDAAGVGVGVPDALQYFRVAKLKEMGCNAIRTSHNEPAEELVEACDHLGMLVMDETRNFASDPQSLANLEQQVRRDRNHPSVFIWSLGNEEPYQRADVDGVIANTMRRLVHRLDPTRRCTVAMSSWSSGKLDGISRGVDVQGFNYFKQGDMDGFHKSNPNQPCIGTEEASDFYTRGIYAETSTYESAYDESYNGNGATAQACFQHDYDPGRPWLAGTFIWTGFDYRGEATPFGWPNISSEFGILDTCGFPKDIFYYYQSWWSDKIVLHLLPHWNWPDKIGQDVNVWSFSNCQEVELFLNGQSLGKKAMPRNSHLQWTVKYEPGTLSAKGYNEGKVVAEEKIETTGAPAAVKLTPDRAMIHGDGEDLSIITVAIADLKGRIVPVANNLVHFAISGPGKIIGVGNGDPICHEPDVYITQPAARSLSLDDWRWKKVDSVRDLPEVAEDFKMDQTWKGADVNAEGGLLKQGESAVFRKTISLSDNDLGSIGAVLSFGMIDDEGWVYVNGKLVGESHDWQSSPDFDVMKFLHAGDNAIVVVVKNGDGEGGVNKGVTLDFEKKPAVPDWQRSAFNGLAQVLVQAHKDAGEIKLTASADGLTPAELVIQVEPTQAVPSNP